MADPPKVREAAQHVLDVEAWYVEGTRTRDDVSQARLVFADVLEQYAAKHWKKRALQMHRDVDPKKEVGVYYFYKLRTLFGTRAIGRIGSSRRNHLVTMIPAWEPWRRKGFVEKIPYARVRYNEYDNRRYEEVG